MPEKVLHLYTDGACRGNPGHGGAGFVLLDDHGNVVEKGGEYLGVCTNNIAEYRALIMGLEVAARHNCDHLHIHLDSELLVNQLTGSYRVRNPRLQVLMEEVKKLFSKIGFYSVTHIPRHRNSLADALANEAIDKNLREIGG